MDQLSDNSMVDNNQISCFDNKLQLTDLPEECLRLVLSHLPVVDKFRLERVCKLWQNIIYDIQSVLRFTKLGVSSGQSSNFCLNREHRATNDDWIPQLMTFSCRTRQSPINISILEKVLQKFGQTLRTLNLDLALINEEVFEVIVKYCPNICCISLNSSTGINDQCLHILGQNYGPKLSHINLQCAANRLLYFTNGGLSQLLSDCPNISVLFLASIRSQKTYRLNTSLLDQMSNIEYLCAHIPDCMITDRPASEQLSHIQHLSRLERLFIDGIIYSETTVEQIIENISELKNLKSLRLYTNCETALDRAFITLATGAKNLQEFYVRVNAITVTTIESLSYFPRLQHLDFGIWKPFETGCLSLNLLTLQFCPELKVLKLSNLLVTDVLLENFDIFCPNLCRIHLNNMFDLSDDSLRSLSKCPKLRVIRITGLPNIASDVTENGLINLLDSLSSLELLEIPIVFDITEDLFSSFKIFSKRNANNFLRFICGDKGLEFEERCRQSGQMFSIVSKY